uniref:Uncharacterized protein n=1 Tax=Clastoptera arizonana TaxID=38151 RepID=A0A1B6EFS7_9HEMI
MPVEIYYNLASPPSRAVLLLAKTLKIVPALHLVDILKGEQFNPDFTELNPQHTVPVLIDEGFIITESQASLIYLADIYDESKSVYPEDVEQTAVIHQRLYFNVGTIMRRLLGAYIMPVIFENKRKVDDENLTMLEEAFNTLNIYLDGQNWVAGDQITIADFSLIASVSTAEAVGFPVSKYPNVMAWLDRCKSTMTGYKEINQEGCDLMAQVYKAKMHSN